MTKSSKTGAGDEPRMKRAPRGAPPERDMPAIAQASNGWQAFAERKQVRVAKRAEADAEWKATRRANGIAQLRAPAPNVVVSGSPSPLAEPGDFPAPTKFEGTLATAGPLALLLLADLTKPEDVTTWQHRFHSQGSRATAEQVRVAQRIAFVLTAALFQGEASPIWKGAPEAIKALLGTQMARRAVIAWLDELQTYKQRSDDFFKLYPDHVDKPHETVRFRAEKTLEELVRIDAAFQSVTVDELLDVIGGQGSAKNIGARGLAVKLSLKCGAFGDVRGPKESSAAATKRVKRNYEKALEEPSRVAT